MRYQYVVILKKKSERASDAFSILLCLFSAISFLLSAFHGIRTTHGNSGAETMYPAAAMLSAGLALLLLIGIAFNIISRVKGRSGVRYRYWLLVAAIGWIGTTATPWVGAFFFLLAFLEYQTKRPLEIGFDQDRIVINALIKRRFDWTMFNNVILKDGLLTLDFKDNRLLQREIADDEDEDDADEEEFNAYCRERLAATA
ncbi:MAG TPA: hypothetical protein VGS79_29265 [Puia sp.]|nr:hypothetical protein [Puia sp.]